MFRIINFILGGVLIFIGFRYSGFIPVFKPVCIIIGVCYLVYAIVGICYSYYFFNIFKGLGKRMDEK